MFRAVTAPPPPQFTSPAGDADPTPKTHGSRGKGGWEADQTRPFTKPKLSGCAQKMLRTCSGNVRAMAGSGDMFRGGAAQGPKFGAKGLTCVHRFARGWMFRATRPTHTGPWSPQVLNPCLTLALSEHRQSNSTHSPSQPRCFKCFRLFPKPELRLAGEFSNPAPNTHLMFAAHVRDPTRVTVASEKTWHQRKRTDLSPCYIVWRRMGWCGDVGVLRRTRFADFW